jgi:hypothetical protein
MESEAQVHMVGILSPDNLTLPLMGSALSPLTMPDPKTNQG